jgi:hypothetical protein
VVADFRPARRLSVCPRTLVLQFRRRRRSRITRAWSGQPRQATRWTPLYAERGLPLKRKPLYGCRLTLAPPCGEPAASQDNHTNVLNSSGPGWWAPTSSSWLLRKRLMKWAPARGANLSPAPAAFRVGAGGFPASEYTIAVPLNAGHGPPQRRTRRITRAWSGHSRRATRWTPGHDQRECHSSAIRYAPLMPTLS